MDPVVYIETTIISYLTSELSANLVVAGHQQVTHEWWLRRRSRFRLVTSAVVLREAGAGDPAMSRQRLALLQGLPLLEITEATLVLAEALVEAGIVPAKVFNDALHLATATIGRADYLMTWNLAHLAGAQARRRIERELRQRGFEPPTLCTPEELGVGND
ncbi:MAG: type II toxin-antitoxin system VapC family toxin [Candidatus Schekmanbacteria bacterium]|nr:type II toxin-antitoxin system VapC family toxin [Candidatus Schekmanbacteria bacterium]